MKKVIIFMLTLCLGLIAKAEDVLQVVPFSTTAGILKNDREKEKSFSINLTNTLTYSALEFHIYLPEGMSLLEEGGSVSPAFEFNDTRFSGYTSQSVWHPYHNINVTTPEPGHYYVKIYCTEKDKELHKIKGTEGELFRVYFLTSENMPSGNYPIYVKGTVLGVDSHTGVYPDDSASYLKIVESVLRGDANCDGAVTVTDIVATASYILGTASESFSVERADCDGNGTITVSDIVYMAQYILNGEWPTQAQVKAILRRNRWLVDK